MIKIGIVGARGLSLMLGLKSRDDVCVEALCDLDQAVLNEAARQHNIPKTYRVYEDMLESGIDAVIISTPMQCHVPQALLAIEAGKHVMMEVTVGVAMDELWWLLEAVEKHNKIFMFAENYCYIPQNQIIASMVKQGLFGDVYYVEGEYLHEIKDLATYNGKSTWRAYWQLGKRGAFYPTHSIGPVMQWLPQERITSVSCFGTGNQSQNQFRQDDTSIVICELTNGKLAKIRVDTISPRPHNMAYYQLQGTKGAYEAPRGFGDDHKVWLDSMGELNWHSLNEFSEYLPERYKNATQAQKDAGHYGGDFFIVEDFINGIKNNVQPELDVYKACEWTAVALLSELSATNGGRKMQMPHFRKNMPREEQIVKL